jgi:hypothetical protein
MMNDDGRPSLCHHRLLGFALTAHLYCIIMGFTKEIIKAGNGEKPRKGQEVTVHCTGYGKDRDLSKKFWSTKDPGQEPFTFAVGKGSGMKMEYDSSGPMCLQCLTDGLLLL